MKRRQFLAAVGLGTAGILGAATLFDSIKLPEKLQLKYKTQFLTEPDIQVLLGILPVIFSDIWEKEVKKEHLAYFIEKLDQAVLFMQADIQDELRHLFDTLRAHILVRILTDVSSDYSDPARVETMLRKWQDSHQHLLAGNQLRHGYMALCNLSYAIWYSNPDSWNITGYDGPLDLG